jgi:hypothetical protein
VTIMCNIAEEIASKGQCHEIIKALVGFSVGPLTCIIKWSELISNSQHFLVKCRRMMESSIIIVINLCLLDDKSQTKKISQPVTLTFVF